MPRYLDRCGEPMTHANWLDCFGDETYRDVRRTAIDDPHGSVATWWVGWCFDHERPPRIFLTELRVRPASLGEEAANVTELAESAWAATEAEAMRQHEAMAMRASEHAERMGGKASERKAG